MSKHGSKKPTKTRNGSQGEALIPKTISLPKSLLLEVEQILDGDPELDFSKYVRRLIRADLQAA